MKLESRASHARPVGWALAAAATLMIGYADLWHGGLTISTLFLTVGYLIVVPIAVMATPTFKRLK